MARPKRGSLPSYRHHKATDQAVVTFNGFDHYLGRYNTPQSKEEYGRVLAEFAATGRVTKGTAEKAPITVVEVLAAYWEYAKGYYVKNGKPTNELDAMRLVIRDCRLLYGRTPADEFGPLALKSVRQVWADRGQARTTVNKNARRLTRIMRWAVAEELVPGSMSY